MLRPDGAKEAYHAAVRGACESVRSMRFGAGTPVARHKRRLGLASR
jgi:hypothetical protein